MKRVAFRFFFGYLTLFILTGQEVPEIPFSGYFVRKYHELWQAIVPWVGKHVLRLGYDITVFTNGSGDTTYDYVRLLCYAAIAAAAAAAGSVLDRRRPDYARLHEWLRLFARFALGFSMILYGAAKVIPVQMGAPYLTQLVQPYGESSPMGLLWTFVAASQGYQMFTGWAELLAGLLLILPATTRLGALMCVGVTTHIFVLNMCYDVPVKIYSGHMLMMSVLLAAPDARRLADMLIFNRRVEPARPVPLFKRRWLHLGTQWLLLVFGLYVAGTSLHDSYRFYLEDKGAPKPPLYGVWDVEEFTLDGQSRPPLLTDQGRWRRVIVQTTKSLTVQPMVGSNQRYNLKLDTSGKRMVLGKRDDQSWTAEFSFEQPAPEVITMNGHLDGKHVQAKLVRFDEKKFLLTNTGFRWIQEYPFNR